MNYLDDDDDDDDDVMMQRMAMRLVLGLRATVVSLRGCCRDLCYTFVVLAAASALLTYHLSGRLPPSTSRQHGDRQLDRPAVQPLRTAVTIENTPIVSYLFSLSKCCSCDNFICETLAFMAKDELSSLCLGR